MQGLLLESGLADKVMPARTFLLSLLLITPLFACSGEGSSSESDASARGKAYYSSICAKCHGADGQGLGSSFPPLAGSEWVTGDEELLIRIALYGLQGEIEVKGKTYRGLMTGFERQLGDEELAAVLTYIRSAWGNAAEPIDSSVVRRVRSKPHPGRPIQANEVTPSRD